MRRKQHETPLFSFSVVFRNSAVIFQHIPLALLCYRSQCAHFSHMICKTWNLRSAVVRNLKIFDHRCLYSMTKTGWSGWVGNVLFRTMMLDADFENILPKRIKLSWFRWLGHMYMIITSTAPFSIFRPSHGVEEASGGERVTWQHRTRKCTSNLCEIGISRLRG